MIHSEQMSIIQFISSRKADLPQGFVHWFASYHLYEDIWVKSERLYNIFLLSQPSYRYSEFLQCVKDTCNEKDIRDGDGDSKVFMISQQGMRSIMTRHDPVIANYYIKLDQCFADYTSYMQSLSQSLMQPAAIIKKSEQLEPKSKVQEMIAFTDGACKANGKPGARASYGVHVIDHPLLERKSLLPADEKQTNQRAELYAILFALRVTKDLAHHLIIYTDSQYSINIFNTWLAGWLKNGLVKENWDIIMQIHQELQGRSYSFIHVRSHQKITSDMSPDQVFLIQGNAKADQLATSCLL